MHIIEEAAEWDELLRREWYDRVNMDGRHRPGKGESSIERSRVALKEWASVIRVLETGGQIMLLRKGGIAEETRDFRLRSRSFYLYPTYEHQKKEWLKDVYRPHVDETIEEWRPEPDFVTVSAFAEAAEELELHDPAELQRLSALHMFTGDYALQRFRWKPAKPLHLLLVRVHRLKEARKVPVRAAYGGCKSWIELGADAPDGVPAEPVLSGEAFAEQAAEVRRLLGR
ncbi:hypothetical protein J31TS4_16260 [Paenibacillus sp. J31TS4]|uniref:DUF1802 family protein n=1 Tax=Paenibacillus sp. J31TS4 TaxID=2807195 RepID=UPI001B2A2DF3|nr:DUF1802 family protein [Paenibacillus sp. J31TS4]GIP38346.1 hypothetical protein J31TS4_16260 [Paenibacillus sp. J31TS4]